MLPSGNSTIRSRPVVPNSSSLMAYQEDYSFSSESSWTASAKANEKRTEPTLEVRPRKRRRTSSGPVVTISSFAKNIVTHSQPLFEDLHSARFNFKDASNVKTHSHGPCQTCRKCESSLFCARCKTPTCSICARTCTLAAVSTPPTPVLCFSVTPSPRPASTRLPVNQLSDSFDEIDVDDLRAQLANAVGTLNNKRRSKSASSSSRLQHDDKGDSSRVMESSFGGCSRAVCQTCAVEDSDSHESTCLDCLDGFGCPSIPTSSPSGFRLRYEIENV